MLASLQQVLSPELFMPHGHCYLWLPSLLWLQVGTNALIAAAYVSIALTLVQLVRRGQYLPFKGTALAFGAFIITCGMTHVMDVYVIWEPAYWLDGSIRLITAIASVGTAIMLPRLVPQAVALARGAKAARERGIALESAVDDLGRLYEKARELDQVKTQFFANVSHELRTPLALILGPSEKLLTADNLTDAQRHDVEVMRRNAQTVLKHVNDLLDVAKLEGGRLETAYADVDAAAMLRLTAAHFDALAAERNVHYQVHTPPALTAQMDPDKVQRVMLNLLSNAFKFTPVSGTVRCELHTDGDQLIIEVADSGPGIRPEQRAQVFERFQQLDTGSTRRFGGTGLGLTIARDFVDLHRGRIDIGDAPEGGALFRVSLPLRAPQGATVSGQWRSDSSETQDQFVQAVDELRHRVEALDTSEAGEGARVLVVEDNPEMNRFVCDVLRDAGFVTQAAADGREALSLVREAAPDIVLTDVMMPNMSGDELVQELRSDPAFDNVPIILLTAKADDDLRVRMLKEGAQDYLMKPFSAAELDARVGNLVTMKRVRDLLQRELDSQMRDLESLTREVTHRKRELQATLESMRIAREHAEQASSVKTNFLRLISHELRTPLASLLLLMEGLRLGDDESLPPQKKALLDRMSASTRRLHDLIEGLLQYTRSTAGRPATEIAATDCVTLVREMVAAARHDADEKGLELVLEPSSASCVDTDPNLVRLIVSNLIQNAIRYTDSGCVKVSVRDTGAEQHIAVSDSGRGIAPADQGRIFEPFEQAEPARHKSVPGVGLGLALVKELAEQVGGRIVLESSLGAGSTFTLVLPRTAEQGPDET